MAPFVVASDGTVYANVAHFQGDVAVTQIIQQARRMKGLLFVGIAVTRQEKKMLGVAVDNAATDAVARIVGARQRRARRSGRSSRRSP